MGKKREKVAATERGSYFLALARNRQTTYEFTDRKVAKSSLNRILESARWAPSAANLQPWHFIVVRNNTMKWMLLRTTYYGVFHTKPALIIVLFLRREDFGYNFPVIKDGKLAYSEALLSVAMPAANIIYQAQDLGISSCILTPDQEAAIKLLKLRKGDVVPLMIGLGYKKTGAFEKKRIRKNLKEMVSYESFREGR